LAGDFVKESTDYKGLLEAIRENSPELFAKIKSSASIPTNIPAEPKKTKTSFWVAVGLDALGVAALGFGIYNNSKAKNYYGDSESLMKNVPGKLEQYTKRESEFRKKYKDAQDAEMMRNIFYATGGALLLGGVAVHIWF